MAKITNKRLGELVQALFRILEKQSEGMKAKEALAVLANTVSLTEYEAGSYESGRRFEKLYALQRWTQCVLAGSSKKAEHGR